MQPFLRQTAAHYAGNPDKLTKTVFVFPNKRSARYFRKEMQGMVPAAEDGRRNIGRLVSINDFFQRIYGVETTARIPLILSLYECYKALNEKAEPLDEFIHWGGVMLSDFDNIDKYMVDASKVFVNVADFRAIQDTYDYLTENQRKAIEHFIAHFRDRNGRITVNMDSDSDDMKARFLRVWNLLAPLYASFNEKLEADGMAYEGKIYKACASRIKGGSDVTALMGARFPGRTRFVFVGLNALNECEKTLLRALRDNGLAEFVWDFSSREIKDPRNRAALFLRKNVEEFPQAFHLDINGLRRPSVRVISVPSSVGQAKLAPSILSETTGSKPEDTVFVLPDENLLMPLLSAIPDTYDTVNVTMGYPMTKSGVYSLMKAYCRMQLSVRIKDDTVYFHHKAVHNIFSNGLFRAVLSEEDAAVVEKVKREAKQYIPMADLQGTPLLETVFSPIMTEAQEEGTDGTRPGSLLNATLPSAAQNHAVEKTLKRILGLIAELIGGKTGTERDAATDVETEFITRYAECIDNIAGNDLDVLPATWMRLLDGLVRGESIPFEGDALAGLQVMGTLETRALDYKNVVIMSANEDVFPHRSVDNSFIPPEIRKGFGLPTTEYQDAVWAYYFYRLIQRAENVWLIYDSRTEGLLSGEESRYIKQLEYHFRFPLKKYTAVAPVMPLAEDAFIPKTDEDIAALKNGHLSASALQSYLACPAKFYYQAVKGLKDEEEVAETMDAAMLGTLFHTCMEKLYKGKPTVTADDIRSILADTRALRAMVSAEICESVKALEVEGRNLVIEEVVLEYIKGALRHDLDLLAKAGSSGFHIIGLERFLQKEIDGFKFIGFADRIDSYKDGEVRVVDYKTGKVEDEDILITDANAAAVTEKLFGETNTGRPKIALQLYLYDQFLHAGLVRPGEKVVNSIYSTARLMTTPLPDVEESEAFSSMVEERLHELLQEISNTAIPWRRTCDKHTCEMCDFRGICGR